MIRLQDIARDLHDQPVPRPRESRGGRRRRRRRERLIAALAPEGIHLTADQARRVEQRLAGREQEEP